MAMRCCLAAAIFKHCLVSRSVTKIFSFLPRGRAEIVQSPEFLKKYFAKQLIDNVPLARHIRQVLDEKLDHRVHEDVFLDELEHYLSKESAQETLKIAINWGRYAELFAFDATSGTLSLENPGS